MKSRPFRALYSAVQKSNNGEKLYTLRKLLAEDSLSAKMKIWLYFYATSATLWLFLLLNVAAFIGATIIRLNHLQGTIVAVGFFACYVATMFIYQLLVLAAAYFLPRDSRSTEARFRKAAANYEEFCVNEGINCVRSIDQVVARFARMNRWALSILTIPCTGLVNALTDNRAFLQLSHFDPKFFLTSLLGGSSLLFAGAFAAYWFFRIYCPLQWAQQLRTQLLCKNMEF